MAYQPKQYIFLQGKSKWFRGNSPDQKFDPPRWSHVLYPNEKSLEIIRELQSQGVKNVLKKDEEGFYITLGRPVWKDYRDRVTGAMKRMTFDPPVLLDKDNNPMTDKTVMVGNGSDITTKMEVYTHGTPSGGKAKAMRWEASKIDNLVPFEKTRDFTDSENYQTKNLDKQPEHDPF